jgi:alkylation response protein AidB-like acyl-CoA dehydrogenase
MHLDDTPDQAAYRATARAWLNAHAELRSDGDDLAGFRALPDAEKLPRARAWQAKKAAAGYAAIMMAPTLGGAGGTPVQHIIYRQEEARFRVPFGVYEIGLGMCLPTLASLAPTLAQRYVPPGIRGEEVWCQLFSEPSAGSDLAALQTRARRENDHWIVNGQKIWTSGAHFSDYGILLARTDVNAPKHAGLTMFVVDMKAPGISVRPIRQMSGESDFNEVFFENVTIADSHRVTAPGAGWQGALTTLMFERMNVGADIGLIDWRAAARHARERKSDDAVTRAKVADWYLESQGVNLFAYRTLAALSEGEAPGPEQSIGKLVTARQAQDVAQFLLDALAEQGALGGEHHGEMWAAVERAWCWGAGMRIAGGGDEILRNVIAERVLQLPGEPRTDKGPRLKTREQI